jgi:mevalonate kinase
VREQWQKTPARLEVTFAAIGQIARLARRAIQTGATEALGPLMYQNQSLLAELDVSSPEIEALVSAARAAGARGAKLAGGGRGGNVIALVDEEHISPVAEALANAGATAVIQTTITDTPESAT